MLLISQGVGAPTHSGDVPEPDLIAQIVDSAAQVVNAPLSGEYVSAHVEFGSKSTSVRLADDDHGELLSVSLPEEYDLGTVSRAENGALVLQEEDADGQGAIVVVQKFDDDSVRLSAVIGSAHDPHITN